jgi:transcriptional regulator with XRE-family HTH domain
MAQRGIPVVQLRRLRAELRRAREEARLTQKQVAEDLGWSLSKVIRLETGAANISTSDVMALLHYYHITDPDRVNSLLSVTRAKERTWWWDEYVDFYGPQFLNFLAYEDSAAGIRQFQALVVPGLLQTEPYARALFTVLEEPQLRIRSWRVRQRRQQLLQRDDPPEATFILDESVVHRLVGSREVMAGQLSHLKKLNTQPHISIQIVPFTAGVISGMRSSFTIFDFSLDNQDSVDFIVVLEEPSSDVLIRDNPEAASNYVEAFDGTRDIAMSKTETNELLDMVIGSIQANVVED